MQCMRLSTVPSEGYNRRMDASRELNEIMSRCDEATRQRLGYYLRVRQRLVELTGDEDINEATPMLGRLYEHHPHRQEIVRTATQLRAIGRLTFSRIDS